MCSFAASADEEVPSGYWPNALASPAIRIAPSSVRSPRRHQISWRRPTRSRCFFRTSVSGMSATRPDSAAAGLSLRVLERGLLPLRVGERHPAGANGGVELVFNLVDVGGTRVGLRPEVAGIGRVPSELETDKVVL